MKNFIFIILAFALFSGCNQNITENEEKTTTQEAHEALQSTLYHQTAAEMRALSYQAFNLARYRLDQSLRKAGLSKQQAVVVDIDETVLDNSPHQARLIKENKRYPEYWAAWCKKAEAESLPGAVEFLNYVHEKGVEVFYVSNRHDSLRKPTLKNLKYLDFPYADDDHILLKTETSGKKKRREIIREKYDIVLLMGDNLADFSEVFEGGTIIDRFDKTDEHKEEFGSRFIVLPNAMYGDWEGAAIDYSYGATPDMLIKKKMNRLRPFGD
ncbi:MAG: 5'-nucleotidase, lipoprotein e(P4) family [Bacteroidota bacterium]